jgi:glycine/D-amino acid oxidase-like deaminating enzyme
VTIVDAAMIGGGATAAGMGHVAVMDDSPAQLALTRYSQALWRELVDGLPADCEYDPCGALWVAADEEELAAAREKEQTLHAQGVAAELLDARQLAETEPQLRPGLAGGLLLPADLVVYSPCVARWLIDQAVNQGAKLMLDRKVASLGGDHVVFADGTRLAAGAVINAAGADAVRLTPRLPIRPRKGHLAITERYPGFVHHQLIELGYIKSASGNARESVAFNVQPRHTGQMLIGSSRQYDSESDADLAVLPGMAGKSAVEAGILGRMLCRAIDYLPGLARVHVLRTWTGFRAATDDKLPLIGPWPEVAGLQLAAGHEGLGITTALGTAELLADIIVGRTSKIPREPYLPERVFSDTTK